MIVARAPLRISLGGGGTDLPSYYTKHGGFILSGAIDKHVYISVNRPSADDLVRVKYSQYEQVERIEDIRHDLVRPALELLDLRSNVEIASMADVPDGTGLGSSGSYLVALLTALHELKRERVPVQALAEEACHIEMDLAGHPVGKQDHYLAAFGGITCLEIQQDGKVRVTPLNVSRSTVEAFVSSVLLFFTGISRSSRTILQQEKERTQNGHHDVLDSLHRTKDLGYRVKAALEEGDVERFGHLLHEHWLQKKRRSEAISSDRIDRWYDIALEHGALGGKLIGAGGGGFLMVVCSEKAKPAVRKALVEAGLREMSYDFDFQGSKTIVNF